MNDKVIADAAVLIPAVSVTWLDLFDGTLSIAVGIVTLIAVLIRLKIVLAEWKSKRK
tara:strand:- start:587 stop:757 length:171 start_codon:yes stop_codon:yes gene_type:complete